MNLRKFISAAILAATLPFAAAAATVSGNVNFDSTTMTGTVYVPGASQFNIVFDAGDLNTSGMLNFDIVNQSSSNVQIDIFSYTINQGNGNFGFQNGVDILFGNTSIGSVGQGDATGSVIEGLMVAGGATESLVFDYGAIYANSGLFPDIDFRIIATAVPLPAAGLLLIGAVGGLGVMRRKKTT